LPERATILLVDDEAMNIEVLAALLAAEYDVVFATDGPRALALAETMLPDLILLDVMMPGMSGYEVCTRLKGNTKTAEIPVIFATILGDRDAETRGLELGAVDYVTKPINPPTVRVRVRNHVELKRGRDELRRLATTDTLTNKRITKRVSTTSGPGATPSMDTDNYDLFQFTSLAAAITSMTTNLTGTPNAGDLLWIQFRDNGTARAITWGSKFAASGTVPLPTTTVASTTLNVGFVYDTTQATPIWSCVAVA